MSAYVVEDRVTVVEFYAVCEECDASSTNSEYFDEIEEWVKEHNEMYHEGWAI